MSDKWQVVIWGSWPPIEYDKEEDARREARRLRAEGVAQVSVQRKISDDEVEFIRDERQGQPDENE